MFKSWGSYLIKVFFVSFWNHFPLLYSVSLGCRYNPVVFLTSARGLFVFGSAVWFRPFHKRARAGGCLWFWWIDVFLFLRHLIFPYLIPAFLELDMSYFVVNILVICQRFFFFFANDLWKHSSFKPLQVSATSIADTDITTTTWMKAARCLCSHRRALFSSFLRCHRCFCSVAKYCVYLVFYLSKFQDFVVLRKPLLPVFGWCCSWMDENSWMLYANFKMLKQQEKGQKKLTIP